jgi:hypothetical protein
MRSVLVIALLTTTAYADRSGVLSAAITGDARATGPDFSTASQNSTSFVWGARATLAFEEPTLPMPQGDWYVSDATLVPELLAGFLADDTRAEGYIGAGARAELRFASNRAAANQHTALYGAARAIVIGKHQDSATEFAIGGYLAHGADHRRFGWETAVMMRPQDRGNAHELDCLVSLYTSWR